MIDDDFLTGFCEATGLNRAEAQEQWVAWSRQLSDKECEQIEDGGFGIALAPVKNLYAVI